MTRTLDPVIQAEDIQGTERKPELKRHARFREQCVGEDKVDFTYAIRMLEGEGGIIFILRNDALRWVQHGNR